MTTTNNPERDALVADLIDTLNQLRAIVGTPAQDADALIDAVRSLADDRAAGQGVELDTWRALCEFLLHADDAMDFLRCWNEGNFEACRREWPEAPEAVYPAAQPEPIAAEPEATDQPVDRCATSASPEEMKVYDAIGANYRKDAAQSSAWSEYVAGMIVAYLGGGVDDGRIKPIAGIISRRLSHLTTPAPEVPADRAALAAEAKQLIGREVNYPHTPRSQAWCREVFATIDRLAAAPAPAAGTLTVRFARGEPGRENDMPTVVSCDWLPDGVYSFAAAPQAPGTQDGEKCWPFAETPGEFARRMQQAWAAFDGNWLAAVRNVLIENPVRLRPVAPEAPVPSSWDEKALASARAISLLWDQDRSQLLARIQCAVLDAMRWAAPEAPAQPVQGEPVAWAVVYEYCQDDKGEVHGECWNSAHVKFDPGVLAARKPDDRFPLYTAPPASTGVVPDARRLIGWRTDDYLKETADIKVACNWEAHHNLLPIFEGDPHTKLAAPTYGGDQGGPAPD